MSQSDKLGDGLRSVDGTKSPPREQGKTVETRKDWEQDEGWSVTLRLKKSEKERRREFNGVEAPDKGLPLRYCFYEKKWLRSGKKTKECPWCNTETCEECDCPVISDAKAARQYLGKLNVTADEVAPDAVP